MEKYKRRNEQDKCNCKKNSQPDPYFKESKIPCKFSLVFNVLYKVFRSKGDCEDHLEMLYEQIIVKSRPVTFTNTVANPWAVMVKSSYTKATLFAMFSP